MIFISIDDVELANLKKICDSSELFGESNFIACIIRNTNSSKNQSLFVSVSHEYCLVYAKDIEALKRKHQDKKWSVPKNNIEEYKRRVKQLQDAGLSEEEITEELKMLTKYPRFIDFTNYWYFDERGLYRKDNLGGVKNGNTEPLFNPVTKRLDPVPPGGYRFNSKKLEELVADKRIHFHSDGSLPTIKRYLHENEEQRPKSIMSDDQRPDYSLLQQMNIPFDNPKQMEFMMRIISIVDQDSIILDFFSGSATTAHAVMQLNAEDGGKRKFIMVQLPEETDEKSEAYKAGYKNICEIGKERIRRAGAKIKEELQQQNQQLKLGEEPRELPDTGFRVLKLASSNMKDVYYAPQDYTQARIDDLIDNIKEGRTPQDLLFQVMLELGVLLSSPITESEVNGQKVFSVADGFLMACFDSNIKEDTITNIAKQRPHYAVFRDSGYATDSVAVNFEQIFKAYSPDTVRRVL